MAIKTAGDPQPEGGGCQGVRPEQAVLRGPGSPPPCQAEEACRELPGFGFLLCTCPLNLINLPILVSWLATGFFFLSFFSLSSISCISFSMSMTRVLRLLCSSMAVLLLMNQSNQRRGLSSLILKSQQINVFFIFNTSRLLYYFTVTFICYFLLLSF